MTVEALVIVAVACLALIMSALIAAPSLAACLVRRRAASLPEWLAERLREEWLAELEHMPGRVGQLVFAVRLALTRRQSLIDATGSSDAIEGQAGAVVLSVDELRIRPDIREQNTAGLIDFALLMVPAVVAAATPMTLATLVLASFVWNALWVLFFQVCFVRLCDGTPGQLCAGLRVITLDGSPLGWRHILRRARACVVPVVVLAPVAVGGAQWLHNVGPLGRSALWMIIMAQALHQHVTRDRNEQPFDHTASGTTVVMKIPRVVSVTDRRPTGSTSPMR